MPVTPVRVQYSDYAFSTLVISLHLRNKASSACNRMLSVQDFVWGL